ncbi:hypothetical protein QYF36_004789 [Acer negundo]|nr:hypothetical protein QYF36_004789 [Acer negundo]
MKLQAVTFPNNISLLLTVLIFLFLSFQTSTSFQNFLKRGSSLSVEDSSHLLTSPDKTFTCGFYSVGDENAYWFSVWFTSSRDRTVVWMANRDRPANGQGSRVSLHRNGAMVLTDVDGTVIWMTNTTPTRVDRAELLDSGNLVLKDMEGKILWQSFDFPTDTLLPSQYLTKNAKLISRLGSGNFGSGYYTFYFDNDNVLRLIYDGPDTSSVYWPNPDLGAFGNERTIYNNSRIAVLDDMGNFSSSDRLYFSAIDLGFGIKRRLTMDYDGNLRLYSLNLTGSWMISWEALREKCNVHGICGRNGICVYTPEPKCSCPPGYEVTEPGNWNKGCKPKFNRTSSNTEKVKFIKLLHVDFYGYDLHYSETTSMESCMKFCSNDSQCEAFSYRLSGEGRCYTKSVLFNGKRTPNFPGSIYLKFPANFEVSEPASLVGTDLVCRPPVSKIMIGSSSMYETAVKRVRWVYLYGFAIAIGAIEIIFFVSGWWFLFRKHNVPSLLEDGYRIISSQFRRYSYAELKKATKNFKEEVGRGGSGAVYKGVLEDEREVAVKRLGDIYQGEEVFWAEVSTIGKIYHMGWKWVGLVLVWIQQKNSIRSNVLIRSNKYLVSELRNSMARIYSILLFITCIYYLGRIPSPIFTKKLKVKETSETEEREEETDVEIETTFERRGTKQEQEVSTEEDPSPSLFLEEKEDPDGNQENSKAKVAPNNTVIIPIKDIRFIMYGIAMKSGRRRATRKIPAATIVAAWIRAEIGVGPSMASGTTQGAPGYGAQEDTWLQSGR